ncbi:hypothetical protein EDC96DRAFT_549143 [Choanephora cucurbitarum]|nr:hypothetical protein EDC96DRAFT_549143 [Choanephora cucurbitarum]
MLFRVSLFVEIYTELNIIVRPIAQRIADISLDTKNWDAVTAAAKRVEIDSHKYGSPIDADADKVFKKTPSPSSQDRSDQSQAGGIMSHETLSTQMRELCQGINDLKLCVNTQMNSVKANQDYSRTTTRPTFPSAYPPANLGNGERRYSEPKCYNCGKIGHNARNCQSRLSNQDNRSSVFQESYTDQSGKSLGRQQ